MNSIEFFRPESQRPLDADGCELPPWLNPFLCDYNPELAEPAPADDEQDPAEWPAWTDLDHWQPGPPAAAPAEPTEADLAWYLTELAELPPIAGGSPAEDDPAGYAEWSRRLEEIALASEWHDRLEQMNWIDGDEACAAAGLPVG
jgi:hypothetical protein